MKVSKMSLTEQHSKILHFLLVLLPLHKFGRSPCWHCLWD